MCKINETIKVAALTFLLFSFTNVADAKSLFGALTISGQIVEPGCTYRPAGNVLNVSCYDSSENKYHNFTSNSPIPEISNFSTIEHYMNDKGTVSTYLVSYN